ncbi:MAG: DUF975 family protein [Spirochaetaceae bacterium]|nr:DUF975 family protein [Spirochaetaceae bacterium]
MEVQIDRVEVKKEAKKLLDGKIWILLLCNLCFLAFVSGAVLIGYLIAETPSSILEDVLTKYDIYNELVYEAVLGFIFLIIFNAIVFPYYVCLTTVPLAIVNNEKITVAKIFAPISKFRYFIEYAIAGVEIFVCTYMWNLLLVFPGLIAAYRYRYAHYILATTEDITAGEAIEKSKELTYENKSQLFVLDLSFIGWVLFGIITCGLGLLFALGYFQVVNAMYYKKIAEVHAAQEKQKKQQKAAKAPEVNESKQEKVEPAENKDNKQEMPESPETQNRQETESTQTQANQEIKEEPVLTENQEKSGNQI